jgi:polysaccharide pyruvyl transferase CsaB
MIAGYYGAKNTGDEAILTGMLHALAEEGLTDVTVLSREPEETAALHGVKSLYIGRRFDGLGSIYKALKETDLFILGGGGLLQDYSTRVVPYWLSRVLLAQLRKVPVIYYAQGMGPLTTPLAQRLVRFFSNRVQLITVRDEASIQLLQQLQVIKPPVELTADPALAIKITSDAHKLLKDEGISLNDQHIHIAVALRSWKGEADYLDNLCDILNQLAQQHPIQYHLVPFQYGEDEAISRDVLRKLEGNQHTILENTYTPEQIAAILGVMDGVLAMRLHALILSAISHTPSYGLVYDPKVAQFMNRLGMPTHKSTLDTLSKYPKECFNKLDVWINQLSIHEEKMQPHVQEMVNQAKRNAKLAAQLIKGGGRLES